jgi:hypothetical protein
MYYSIASKQNPTWGDHRGRWENSEFGHSLMIGNTQTNVLVSFGGQLGVFEICTFRSTEMKPTKRHIYF